jgi:TadE-like protein
LRRRHARVGDQGSAAVEFILVLPVLLLILFAIVDLGRMLHAKIQLAEAAREGVRAAALVDVDEGEQTINDVVGGMAADMDHPYGIDGCDGATPGQDATVTLTYHFEFVTPLAAFAGFGGDGGDVELTQTALMPCM